MLTKKLLNQAIPLYLGMGVSSFPKEDKSRLTAKFGKDLSVELHSELEKLLIEFFEFKPDEKIDLNKATELALKRIQKIHPHLGPEALAALGWYYSYTWK